MAKAKGTDIFVDVDTQVDFMLPHGNLYVPGAERLIPNLSSLIQFAQQHHIPLISSVDAHPPNDEEFRQFPPHCVQGTSGQEKIPGTLLPQRVVLTNSAQPLPAHVELLQTPQWILEKQKFDLFTNANAEVLFDALSAERCVVFGVATEYCVRAAVLGLLRTGREVLLVEDAIQGIGEAATQDALREMQTAGTKLVTTQGVLSEAIAA